jgi:carbonic anhydrase/acetyltransferase-like protein (isoleucine patch superfamily)
MFPGVSMILEAGAHIGHGAVIHGAHLGKNTMVGMNAVIMDDVYLGDESIVGALSFVKAGEQVPPRSLMVGNPAKVIKQVSDEMLAWKTKGTKLYQSLPKDCFEHLKATESLSEIPKERPDQEHLFRTWNEIKGK